MKKIGVVIISVLVLFSMGMDNVLSSSIIVFSDTNLRDELCTYYNHEGDFTKKEAEELSYNDAGPVLENAKISDLEGLQYFIGLKNIFIGDNDLKNLKPLSKLPELGLLNISNNSIKGKSFEKALNSMGLIENLHDLNLDSNGLSNIDFLDKIGNINNFTVLSMANNKIRDISILEGATNLDTIDMRNNRIADVTPLKDLDNLIWYIDLRDNCIIDYSPIKPLFDKMFEEMDPANMIERYDYYSNPVNFKYNGKTIKFPYLTVYYKCQAYAEATPLFKALGGSAQYDKKTGILTCKFDGNVLVFKDFSKSYTFNGKKKDLKYEMRRMQYDLAYIPVKDVCEALGLEYDVVSTRSLYVIDEQFEDAPKLVEIRKTEKELG